MIDFFLFTGLFSLFAFLCLNIFYFMSDWKKGRKVSVIEFLMEALVFIFIPFVGILVSIFERIKF